MKQTTSPVATPGRLRAAPLLVALAAASLSVAASCDSTGEPISTVPCMSDAECRSGCEALCMGDPFVTTGCDLSRGICACNCDAGAGGSGGAGGAGGDGGAGGEGGTAGAQGQLCGGDTSCTAASPSNCGTICIDPICGGLDNFDSAGCGENERCFCVCLEDVCTDLP